jgi:very-short-patch-repair endonuclease
MDPTIVQSSVWGLVRAQHGVVARRQLLALGYSGDAIAHRVGTGRLHPVWRGVYAVGRPDLTREGRWMAAVLACGPDAVLSHQTAAVLWQIVPLQHGPTHLSVPLSVRRGRTGIVVHRRAALGAEEVTHRRGIPVTTVVTTLVDLAAVVARDRLEAAINQVDKLDLMDPERLRAVLEQRPARPGRATLRQTPDRRTFTLTDSELERRFLPLARRAGLPRPDTQARVNGFRVDFYWPDLSLVVETDGLRYHRTPAQQAQDRVRDHAHIVAGLTSLRFTHAQVRYEAAHVQATLQAVRERLRG